MHHMGMPEVVFTRISSRLFLPTNVVGLSLYYISRFIQRA